MTPELKNLIIALYDDGTYALGFFDEYTHSELVKECGKFCMEEFHIWTERINHSFREIIVSYDGKFYAINESRQRSSTGPWDYNDPEVFEVTKCVKLVETISWESK